MNRVEKWPIHERLSSKPRLGAECADIRAAFRQRDDLAYVELDNETFDNYQEPISKIARETFDKTEAEHEHWVEKVRYCLGFKVLLLLKGEEVIGWQASETPTFDELSPQLQLYLADHVHNPHLRNIMYINKMAIAEMHRGQGLGVGLWLISDEDMAKKSMLNGALIVYRVQHGNTRAENVAYAVGHTPTRLTETRRRNRSTIYWEAMRYWYSEVPPLIQRPLESPFEYEIYSSETLKNARSR